MLLQVLRLLCMTAAVQDKAVQRIPEEHTATHNSPPVGKSADQKTCSQALQNTTADVERPEVRHLLKEAQESRHACTRQAHAQACDKCKETSLTLRLGDQQKPKSLAAGGFSTSQTASQGGTCVNTQVDTDGSAQAGSTKAAIQVPPMYMLPV